MADYEAWQREKRALEERVRQLEALNAPQQPHPPQPLPLDTARMPTPAEIDSTYEKLSMLIPESSTGQNAKLLAHLETIVKNLLMIPYNNPKYRRLRMSNTTLQTELLSHPASAGVLRFIGFVEETDAATGDRFLVVPPSVAEHLTFVRSIKPCVQRLSQRDDIAAEAANRFASFRRTVAFEIRMERLAQATQEASLTASQPDPDDVLTSTNEQPPTLEAYVSTCLLWNDCDIADKVIGLLRTITENIRNDPENEKFRTLRLSSALLRDVVFPAQGAVEFLIAILGFGWTADGMYLPPIEDIAAFRARSDVGLNLLSRASALAAEKRKAENELRRQAALQERESEKRRLQSERAKVPRPTMDGDDSATSPSDSKPSTGQRVAIADALKALLGRQTENW